MSLADNKLHICILFPTPVNNVGNIKPWWS